MVTFARVVYPRPAGVLSWAALLLLASGANLAAETSGPFADGEQLEELEDVVVTGSHVRRDAFTSPSPIQVIEREAAVLAGVATTTDVLQGSTVTGGGQQINNYFGDYVIDGGPGVNTLSLRGLGAARTLVLLNGRRLAPSGTRGSVGAPDLNVLPSSALIERIEVLKDGASSTYGSDAVAGVVNIITRDGFNGMNVEAHRSSTFDGGGNETGFTFSGGMSGRRGHLLGSFEIYDRTHLTIGDRDWSRCPTQVLIDPATGEYVPDGSILNQDGTPRCFPISTLSGVFPGIAHGYVVAPVCDNVTYEDCVFARAVPDNTGTADIPGWRGVDDVADRPAFDPRQLRTSLISPTRNYTGFLSGALDTSVMGDAELYFEGLFHRRESSQTGTTQLQLDYQSDADFNPHPFVPETLTAPGPGLDWGGVGFNPFGDYIIARSFTILGNDRPTQESNFGRLVTGLRGNLDFAAGWRYDVNLALNRSRGRYAAESALNDRVYNSTYVTEVAPGFDGPTRVGFDGLTYTCQVNVDVPGSGCVPAPLLDADFLASNIPQDYRDYIWQDIIGHTTYRESTVSAIFDGPLATLPYGRLRGAIGAEARWMKLNDVPSVEMQNQNIYQQSSAGITRGKDNVAEVFGELDIPLLAGLPAAESLTLNLSARYTDYDSYGSDTTYKVGAEYLPTSWLRLRATRGTSFRAPAIYEQFLAPTSGFLPSQTDPCNQYGDLPATSTTYINCAAEGLDPDFIQQNSVQVNSGGGAALGLKSEASTASTAGISLQPHLAAGAPQLSFAVDWWRIKVKNQVMQIGGDYLLDYCYADPDFRAGGGYCTFSTRDNNDELVVDDLFRNIARQKAEGLDFNLRAEHAIGPGRFGADLRATRFLHQTSQLVPEDQVDEFNGTVTMPKLVGDLDLRYAWGNWTAYYGLVYVGVQDSNAYLDVDPSVDPYDFRTSAYLMHNASVRYTAADDWSVVLGIRNLTDVTPRTISPGDYPNRVGNAPLYSGYDYFGRRGFVTLSKSF
ncbi:MAG TPA: TonB-dependent receptor [Steroidobacteraceae bacterium]|nr:TonB-dependent receptor [Steroidobacteraceae bacterium]